jgi:hypothetical protein
MLGKEARNLLSDARCSASDQRNFMI